MIHSYIIHTYGFVCHGWPLLQYLVRYDGTTIPRIRTMLPWLTCRWLVGKPQHMIIWTICTSNIPCMLKLVSRKPIHTECMSWLVIIISQNFLFRHHSLDYPAALRWPCMACVCWRPLVSEPMQRYLGCWSPPGDMVNPYVECIC